MAITGFGVTELNLIGSSGTPKIESPNNLNLNAVTVAISTNATVGGTATFGGDVDIADTIYHTGDSNTKIRFPANDTITFHTSGDEQFRIDSSGRVLINTTNNSNGHIAASNLAVQGADLSIFKDSGGDNSGVSGHKLKFVTQSGSLGEIDVLSEGGGGPSGRGGSMRFYTKTNNIASATERLCIDSNGNVGIGSTQPSCLLDVRGGVNVTGISTFNDDVQFKGALYNSLWDEATSKFKLYDLAQIAFGDGNDLQIYSDGTYGIIKGNDTTKISGITQLDVSGVTTSTGGFVSAASTTAVQITVAANILTFTAVGIGSTSFTLS